MIGGQLLELRRLRRGEPLLGPHVDGPGEGVVEAGGHGKADEQRDVEVGEERLAAGLVPVDVSIDERIADGAADVRFAAVPADEVEVVGAFPKAVSLHELRFARAGGAWRCQVTVDV